MQIVTPPAFNKQHEIALAVYLHNPHGLDTAVWQQLYQAIDLLSQAQVIMDDTHRTFH